MRRRHVGIVASNGGADVAVAGDEPIRWIESYPTKLRHKRFDPCMRRGVHATVFFVAVKEIAADVTTRNPKTRAHQRDHHMRKILADTGFILQSYIDR